MYSAVNMTFILVYSRSSLSWRISKNRNRKDADIPGKDGRLNTHIFICSFRKFH